MVIGKAMTHCVGCLMYYLEGDEHTNPYTNKEMKLTTPALIRRILLFFSIHITFKFVLKII